MSTININVSKTDMGLDQVDNTSDLNKPISTATQTALNLNPKRCKLLLSWLRVHA